MPLSIHTHIYERNFIVRIGLKYIQTYTYKDIPLYSVCMSILVYGCTKICDISYKFCLLCQILAPPTPFYCLLIENLPPLKKVNSNHLTKWQKPGFSKKKKWQKPFFQFRCFFPMVRINK